MVGEYRHERFGQFLGCVLHVQGAADGAGGFAEHQQSVTGLVLGCHVDTPVRDRAQVSVVVSDRPESDGPRVGPFLGLEAIGDVEVRGLAGAPYLAHPGVHAVDHRLGQRGVIERVAAQFVHP
ncbi:hypothetical protein SCHAM137S_02113 [Streptomyces chartreusis]